MPAAAEGRRALPPFASRDAVTGCEDHRRLPAARRLRALADRYRRSVTRALSAAALLAVLATSGATSTTAAAEPSRRPVSRTRRAAAIGAAIFPGVLVHGVGSYVVGEHRAARRLLTTELVGLGVTATGAVPIAYSGGSQYTIAGVSIAILGAGLILPTWFADLAVAAGASRTGSPHALPPWSLEVGTTWLHDPYRQRGLVELAGAADLGRLGLGAATLLDADGDQWTVEVGARWRLYGAAATGTSIAHGDRLVIATALRHHRDRLDDVTIDTGDFLVAGRADLSRLDPALAGQFLEASAGAGIERAGFRSDAHDLNSLLLGGFGYGLYLGRGAEVSMFYDHRRDGMAGGIDAWRAAGFVGSVGVRAHARLAPHWLVRGELQIGNGWVTTAALRYEGGSR